MMMNGAPESKVRILVVEDDPHVRRMLDLLLGARWSVELADSGQAARDLAWSSPPDLIISDVRMPGMDGIALLRELRAAPATQDVPIILVSARAGEPEIIAALEAGADDFLIKPFSARELLVRVQARLDVTLMRRRNAQQEAALAALQSHNEWTEKLLDSLPVPLFLLAPPDARTLFANAAARRLIGDAPVRGAGLGDCLALCRPEDEGGGALDAAQLVSADPSVRVRGQRVLSTTAQGSVWLLADAELLPAMHDRSPVAVLSLRDVTDLVRKEDELRSALHLRDEFLSVASHELRTPITTLNLHTDAALKALASRPDGPGDERLFRRLSSIRGQMTRLEQLVEALLDVSRLIEGRLQLRPEEVDVGAIATDAVESLRESASRAGSTINLRCAAAVVGSWDRLRIGQVVTNLVSNAIKFGGGHPIDVEVEDEGPQACLRVRDGGIGIASELTTRIFERFERGVSERHYPGLGLGLWITKQIVDACHGSIVVESQPGVGSTFIVKLPRVVDVVDGHGPDPG